MSSPVQGRPRRDPLDDILESVQKQQGADPLDDILGGSQATGDPLDDILGDTALMSGSSRAPVTDPSLRQRYVGAIQGIIDDPVAAIKGMAKSVLFDALKATVTPIKGFDPFPMPESVRRLLPTEVTQPQSPLEYGRAVLSTAANVGLPAAKSFKAAAVIGAGAGVLGSPDDPALGAALGGTLGPVVHGAIKTGGAIGRAAGIKRSKGVPPPAVPGVKTQTPIPTPAVVPDAAAVAPRSAIRDMTNADVLGMTPKGIEIVAKQAAKEEAALLTELFGPKGARRYRSAARRAESSVDSPETAAKALASLESMKSSLSENQQRALEEINARGFTSKRLATIAKVTKDYTSENLAKIADEDLVRQFGEVLMTKRPDRNLSGLYRLRAIYGELDTRGLDDAVVTRGVYDYMTAQGIKPEGLGALIIGKMHDVRKTLAKVEPEKVQPEADAVPVAPLREDLGTVSETQLQQELTDLVPPPATVPDPMAAAADRVQAARTTPFPGQAQLEQQLSPESAAVIAAARNRSSVAGSIQDNYSKAPGTYLKTRETDYPLEDIGLTGLQGLRDELSGVVRLGKKKLVDPKATAEDIAADIALIDKRLGNPAPDIKTVISSPSSTATPLVDEFLANGQWTMREVLNEYTGGFEKNKQGVIRRIANAAVERKGEIGGEPPYAAVEAELALLAGQGKQPTGPLQEQIARFVNDESGQLNVDKILALVEQARQLDQTTLKELFGTAATAYQSAWRVVRNAASTQFEADAASQTMRNLESKLTPEQLQRLDNVGTHFGFDIQELEVIARTRQALTDLVKDETGYLDLTKLSSVVDKFKSEPEGQLPAHSKRLQDQLVDKPRPLDDPRAPEGWYSALARKTMFLEKVEKKIAKAGGKITTRESPAANIQLLAGYAGKIERLMKKGGFREVEVSPGRYEFVDTGTPGAENILHSVKGRQKAFDRILLAKRVAELDDQGRKLISNASPEDARLEIGGASPELLEAQRNWVQLLRDTKQLAVDGGLLNDQTSAVLDFFGENYIPLGRYLDGESAKPPTRSQTTALGVPDPFRYLEGSGLKIVSPRYNSVDYIRRVVRASELNRVANSIVDLVNKFPEQTKGWILERAKNADVDASRPIDVSGKDLVKMFKAAGLNLGEDSARETAALLSKRSLLMDADWMRYRDKTTGQVHQVKLDPGLAEIVRSLSPGDIGLMEQFLALGAQSVRTGVAVLDPVFAVRQLVVDAFHARMNSTYGFKMGRSTLDGFVAYAKQNKDLWDFKAAGGAYSTFLPSGRGTEQTLRSITPRSKIAGLGVALWNPVDTMARLMDPLIELNKLGEYVAARRKGADVFEAALAAREVAGDLAMTGTKLAAMRRMTAFLGPFIAGTEKTFRTARTRPAATLAAGIQAISIPSALLWWAATGDDGVRDLQRSEQGKNFWFLRVGPEIVKVRKPQLWGQFFGGTMEAALDQMETENPEGYVRAMEGFARELLPPGLPNTIEVFEGLRTGVDPRTKIPIVPAARENLDPEFQFGYQTSETAKRLGEWAGKVRDAGIPTILDFSPASIDYAIRNLTGSFGAAALKGSDQLLGYRGVSPPSPVAADFPLLGQVFGRSPSSMAEPLTTFYKNAELTAKRLNTAKELAEKFQAEKLSEYMERHAMDIALAKGYAEARADLTKLRQFVEEVRSYPDDVMSREDKRELIDTAMEQMIERVRPWNDVVRDIRKSNKSALVGAP